ncbi:MAG: sigma-70 family RNA polymerase sigma factor [Spirochaetales bacterium]|nr:sigma-70 family RNA polymerase sigma factor [Spirochaetales bacterium]
MKEKSKKFSLFINSALVTNKREIVFNDIWEEYYPKLTVYIKTTYSLTETEDIVQEILLKVYSNLHRYNPLYSFNTWIYSIAKNCAVDSFRKKSNSSKVLEAVINEAGLNYLYNNESPEKLLIKKEVKTELAECIENLPETERQIAFLKFYEGLTYKEISKIVEIPVGTLKYIVHNIKKKVETYYGKQFEEKYGGQYGS